MNTGLCLREEMIRTNEIIHRTVEGAEIRDPCKRMFEGMREKI